ncbi:MAG: DNA polymerase III subunit epsilon [Xanthomonadaceae bacterium]|nr:DNA polymerase III subunit epsilon [Xanthomonadaceae bacterium]
MRQIVLDTETTGLEVGKGHRIIEIGCIELIERRPSGRRFHRYLNPQRAIDEGARAVHGISDEFLADKPRFAEVAAEFLAFVDGAELVIHNAAFDVSFLDAELALTDPGLGRVADHANVLDTLALAREKYPGQRISLDALCKRLNIDNRHRELHGALLDAQLLADVYLAMTGGQGDLGLASAPTAAGPVLAATQSVARHPLRVRRADVAEAFAHETRLQAIDTASKGRCLWRA